MKSLKLSIIIILGVFFVLGARYVLLNDNVLKRFRLDFQDFYASITAYLSTEELVITSNVCDEPADIDEVNELACDDPVPKNGGHFVLSTFKGNLKNKSRVYISNEHIYPIWVKFYDGLTYEDQVRLYVEPNKSHLFYLPVNDYYVEINSGTEWCNSEVGFVEPFLVESDKLVNIQPKQVVNLRILSFGNHPSNMMLSMRDSLGFSGYGDKRIQGSGSLTLEPVAGGHFAVQGSINHKPAFFIVDTGASIVSVPVSFAKHAGITECRRSKSITAGGIVDTCRATAKTLTIGQFTLRNVELSYGKGLEPDTFLLGMNVISQFKLEQHGDIMKLSLSR